MEEIDKPQQKIIETFKQGSESKIENILKNDGKKVLENISTDTLSLIINSNLKRLRQEYENYRKKPNQLLLTENNKEFYEKDVPERPKWLRQVFEIIIEREWNRLYPQNNYKILYANSQSLHKDMAKSIIKPDSAQNLIEDEGSTPSTEMEQDFSHYLIEASVRPFRILTELGILNKDIREETESIAEIFTNMQEILKKLQSELASGVTDLTIENLIDALESIVLKEQVEENSQAKPKDDDRDHIKRKIENLRTMAASWIAISQAQKLLVDQSNLMVSPKEASDLKKLSESGLIELYRSDIREKKIIDFMEEVQPNEKSKNTIEQLVNENENSKNTNTQSTKECGRIRTKYNDILKKVYKANLKIATLDRFIHTFLKEESQNSMALKGTGFEVLYDDLVIGTLQKILQKREELLNKCGFAPKDRAAVGFTSGYGSLSTCNLSGTPLLAAKGSKGVNLIEERVVLHFRTFLNPSSENSFAKNGRTEILESASNSAGSSLSQAENQRKDFGRQAYQDLLSKTKKSTKNEGNGYSASNIIENEDYVEVEHSNLDDLNVLSLYRPSLTSSENISQNIINIQPEKWELGSFNSKLEELENTQKNLLIKAPVDRESKLGSNINDSINDSTNDSTNDSIKVIEEMRATQSLLKDMLCAYGHNNPGDRDTKTRVNTLQKALKNQNVRTHKLQEHILKDLENRVVNLEQRLSAIEKLSSNQEVLKNLKSYHNQLKSLLNLIAKMKKTPDSLASQSLVQNLVETLKNIKNDDSLIESIQKAQDKKSELLQTYYSEEKQNDLKQKYQTILTQCEQYVRTPKSTDQDGTSQRRIQEASIRTAIRTFRQTSEDCSWNLGALDRQQAVMFDNQIQPYFEEIHNIMPKLGLSTPDLGMGYTRSYDRNLSLDSWNDQSLSWISQCLLDIQWIWKNIMMATAKISEYSKNDRLDLAQNQVQILFSDQKLLPIGPISSLINKAASSLVSSQSKNSSQTKKTDKPGRCETF